MNHCIVTGTYSLLSHMPIHSNKNLIKGNNKKMAILYNDASFQSWRSPKKSATSAISANVSAGAFGLIRLHLGSTHSRILMDSNFAGVWPKGPSINEVVLFFESFDPTLPLSRHHLWAWPHGGDVAPRFMLRGRVFLNLQLWQLVTLKPFNLQNLNLQHLEI